MEKFGILCVPLRNLYLSFTHSDCLHFSVRNGFQKLDKIKDSNRQSKQLEDLTAKMKECKRLIKEFDREIKDEEKRNSPEMTKQLKDEKQSMINELNSYVALRKMYMGTGASEPMADDNVQVASGTPQLVTGYSLKFVGVGGGGYKVVNMMIGSGSISGLKGIDFCAMDTDAKALSYSAAKNSILIGKDSRKGLGTGGNPRLGEEAALESAEIISNALAGADIVFVTAAMGGGTGSGAAPIVAEMSKKAGHLTVGVITCPFCFEGSRRTVQAHEAIEKLQKNVDTLIVIPNDRVVDIVDEGALFQDAFLLADEVLRRVLQGISDLITIPGLVKVDIADVKAIMKNSGTAMLGVGLSSSGQNGAEKAAKQAVLAPLSGSSIQFATGVVCHITGGKDLTLEEVTKVSQVVTSFTNPSANIIFGTAVDEGSNGLIRVTIIATGFNQSFQKTFLEELCPERIRIENKEQQINVLIAKLRDDLKGMI